MHSLRQRMLQLLNEGKITQAHRLYAQETGRVIPTDSALLRVAAWNVHEKAGGLTDTPPLNCAQCTKSGDLNLTVYGWVCSTCRDDVGL